MDSEILLPRPFFINFNLILISSLLSFKENYCIMVSTKVHARKHCMEHMEMINKLHEKAGISYDDARDALMRSNWDMLEALSILEREGKIAPLTSSISTANDGTQYEEVKATASADEDKFSSTISKLGVKLKELFIKLMENSFVMRREGKEMISLPLLFAAIITLCIPWAVAAGLVIGFFFDCGYSIEERK